MRAGYFTIETTGPHHDRDHLVHFEGVLFDHSSHCVMSRLKYEVVADMYLVNDMPVPAYRAAMLMQEWLSDDCFFFGVNVDKAKHFLRSTFFYQYLNPFEHEHSGRQNKLLDIMMLLRAACHMGESPVEIPISPLGEVSYEFDAIQKRNFPYTSKVEAMALMVDRVMANGGKPFQWIKSQDEKRRLFMKGRPVVYLGLVDKELEVMPRTLYPIGQSEVNRNRFYFFEPSEVITSPFDAIEVYQEHQRRGWQHETCEMKGRGLIYLDVNKTDLVVGIDEVSARYQLDHLGPRIRRKKKAALSKVILLIDKIHEMESERPYPQEGKSFYEASMRRHHVARWAEVRYLLLQGDWEGAVRALGREAGHPSEARRVARFMRDNGIKSRCEKEAACDREVNLTK